MISNDVICSIEEYAKQYMINYDCSHDWLHVQRVRKMARKLALAESEVFEHIDLELIDMAALLHDIGDVKYSKESARETITKLLYTYEFPDSYIEKVCFIVENVSFRKELEHIEQGRLDKVYNAANVELRCVQDADRLDAIGAIGLARCLTFSGARNRPIYDPNCPPIPILTASEYNKQTASSNGTAFNHFYEKLLLLDGMMKTRLGRDIALKRSRFIKSFINQMKDECEITW